MTKLSRVWAIAVSALLAGSVASCGGADDGDPTDGAATTPSATSGGMEESPSDDSMGDDATDDSMDDAATDDSMGADGAAGTATVTTAETDLGTILVDGEGMTLYLFTNDEPGVSNCEGDCLAAWPPLLGTPQAGEGADDSKLGTIERSDGTTQVTYNDWPLYYWMNDSAPGDTTGQGVNGVWWVVDRDGEAIM